MPYSRFKNTEFVALAAVVIGWTGALIYGWMPVLSPVLDEAVSAVDEMILPSFLTVVAVSSCYLWRFSRSSEQRLLANILNTSRQWRQGSINVRLTHIGGKERALQQLAWALNDLMDQVETAHVDMHYSLANVTYGDFTRRSHPEGLHGGFSHTLKQLNTVTKPLAATTVAVTDLMSALAEGDFNKRVDVDVDGEYRLAIDHAMQAMQAMQTMLGDIGQVMDGVAQGDINRRVKAEGSGDLAKLKDNINLSLSMPSAA